MWESPMGQYADTCCSVKARPTTRPHHSAQHITMPAETCNRQSNRHRSVQQRHGQGV